MPRPTTVDFTDAPPAQGSLGQDYINPGKYRFANEIVEETASKSGKKMYVATLIVVTPDGQKKLIDRFVIDTDPGKTPFGKQRFHAYLLALGLGVKQQSVAFDLDRLTGLGGIVDVVDEQQAANGEYAARTVSRALAYYPLSAATAAPAAVAAPAAAPAPAAAAPAPVAAPVAPAAAPVAVPVAAAEPVVADVAAAVDDLFS